MLFKMLNTFNESFFLMYLGLSVLEEPINLGTYEEYLRNSA